MEDHAEIAKLNQTMEEVVKPTLVRIEMQTTKTNGTVRSLQQWKSFMMGGLAVIGAVLLPLIFIVVQMYYKSIAKYSNIEQFTSNHKIVDNSH